MLVAENHGKICPEIQGSEDYLTSAIFGHLRYVPPRYFWQSLFEASKSSETDEQPLTARLAGKLSEYRALKLYFWPAHRTLGQPDVVLRFYDGEQPDVFIIVEAKLWSGKSGRGEADQLVRYCRILDAPDFQDFTVEPSSQRFLVYLTPRDSLAEIEESAALCKPGLTRERVYRLRWQDVLYAAEHSANGCEPPLKELLGDVATFLKRRGLEYFGGFKSCDGLDIKRQDGHFYTSAEK